MKNLPTPQYTRLVSNLANALHNSTLDVTVLSWDHIAERYLKHLVHDRVFAGRVRSIRLLAIHDAIHAILDPGSGYIFTGSSSGSTVVAARAASIRASHDVLASVFTDPKDLADLGHLLEESLSLIPDGPEKQAGIKTGEDSAAAYILAFSRISSPPSLATGRSGEIPFPRSRWHQSGWKRSA